MKFDNTQVCYHTATVPHRENVLFFVWVGTLLTKGNIKGVQQHGFGEYLLFKWVLAMVCF